MRNPNFLLAVVIAATLLGAGQKAHACGPDTDCMIGEDRHYRVKMPDNHDGATKIGAIIFAHGYRGSAAGAMRNKHLARIASDLGVALVAVKSYRDDWRIPGVPRNTGTDGHLEFDYFDALVADLGTRFAIDTKQLLMTGFSAGGMMVWNLACHRSELFTGFVPMSGTFWKPEPETCTGPVASILHIHGDTDPVVPLTGRKIADTHQGDVRTVLDMYTRYGDFGPASMEARDDWRCENRINGAGQFLDFCLFKGGHSFKTSHVRRAWERFVAAGILQ